MTFKVLYLFTRFNGSEFFAARPVRLALEAQVSIIFPLVGIFALHDWYCDDC